MTGKQKGAEFLPDCRPSCRKERDASGWGGSDEAERLNPNGIPDDPEHHRSVATALLIASDRIDALTTLELLVNGAPKTQYISAVIGDLEGPESIARIGQFPMQGNLPS